MKPTRALLALSLLALAACSGGTGSSGYAPSGGSAGAQGPGYCHSAPSGAFQQDRWTSLCFGR